MILFDYGQTLVNKKKFDGIAGTRAVLQYVTKNKYNRTAEEVQAAAEVINVELGRFDPKRRHLNQIEVPNHMRCGIQIQKVYRYKQRKAFPKCQNRQFSYGKLAVLVRAAGLEPTVSWSQTKRDTKLR